MELKTYPCLMGDDQGEYGVPVQMVARSYDSAVRAGEIMTMPGGLLHGHVAIILDLPQDYASR